MSKLAPLLKILFKVLEAIIHVSIIIAILFFEIKEPKYDWIYIIIWWGQGLIAGFINTKVSKELNQFYENIFN